MGDIADEHAADYWGAVGAGELPFPDDRPLREWRIVAPPAFILRDERRANVVLTCGCSFILNPGAALLTHAHRADGIATTIGSAHP